ncbi:hypothetical protein GWE18_22760 [Bradyrhizobium sp. CSA112]|uniref:hypothetical protein n=1 Tax=Bradyrhizobium sp. CSA112 TaxID=2699170 RepID=UPI0023B07DEE|nr:hypothetical protein [Bradyrhizobium sp. CSA112]MDE5455608.1 hypothetical protein [Bradyrhizobium sp. CSA112]
MRRLILAATAVAALAGAGSLVSTRADAMPANGGLGASVARELTEPVALVCERRWNGYRWARACYETGPDYYYGGPSIVFGFGGGGLHHHHGHHGHHFGHHGHHFGHHGGHHGGRH